MSYDDDDETGNIFTESRRGLESLFNKARFIDPSKTVWINIDFHTSDTGYRLDRPNGKSFDDIIEMSDEGIFITMKHTLKKWKHLHRVAINVSSVQFYPWTSIISSSLWSESIVDGDKDGIDGYIH